MKHFLLLYDVCDGYETKRVPFRELHLKHGWAAHERGELVLAGALANPIDGAILLFRGETPEVAEAFARTDPYVTNGLVVHWRVREWATVIGAGAATPLQPKPS